MNYIIATDKPWHVKYFLENRHELKGNWSLATCAEDLEVQASMLNPRFIFFPHWSEIVPARIFEKYECVCFHMTDVPFGRGGSPLQNLIINGHSETFISALRMTKDIDAGPIYLKRKLQLTGSALDIFERSAPICFDLISQIQIEEVKPVEQKGKPTYFQRRKPEESQVPKNISTDKLYDLIRMLDAPNYPSAFMLHGDLRIEFFDAIIDDDYTISAKVKITKYEN